MKTMMKALMILLATVTLCSAQGSHYSRGYYRSNGTYVQPHWQTNPDGNPYNNWGTYPNTNPYTGRQGTIHIMPRDRGLYSDPYNLNR